MVLAALPGGAVAPVRAEPGAGVAGLPGVAVTATGAALAEVKGWTVPAGRFLDEPDLATQARVAVISGDLLRRTGKKPGDIVWIGRDPFLVVGVVNTGGTPEDGV
ncbi:MAG: ABC transporter permease [Kiritimatiellia bacterium]